MKIATAFLIIINQTLNQDSVSKFVKKFKPLPLKKRNWLLSLIGQPNMTVKRTEELILIRGYTTGNNRQLTVRQFAIGLGFADNRLRRKDCK